MSGEAETVVLKGKSVKLRVGDLITFNTMTKHGVITREYVGRDSKGSILLRMEDGLSCVVLSEEVFFQHSVIGITSVDAKESD